MRPGGTCTSSTRTNAFSNASLCVSAATFNGSGPCDPAATQRSTRRLAELKIGVMSILAIVIAAVLIFAVSGSGGFSWQRYPLKAVFTNIAGLNEGAQVRIAGLPVGAVTAIELVGEQVEVTFEIREEMRPRVTSMSVASGAASVSKFPGI